MDWLEGFIAAGAVVAELGGRTSHAATICRELGKPCVTGVDDATTLIANGATVQIDGTAGRVLVHGD
jgi:phosphohistidine swiveling domain-containing protein